MKYLFNILIASLIFILTSCSDFLDLKPRHKWEVDKTMTTYNKAVQSVNGIYGIFMPEDNLNQAYYAALTTKSGFMLLTNTNDYDLIYDQTTGGNSSIWSTCYEAINACNLAVNGIPKVPASAFPNDKISNELIGEARFLRGYLHSIILLNYCLWWDNDDNKYGMIYRDQTTDVSNVNRPRLTVGESWKKVMDDIDFGIENMPATFTTARKASKVFAKAYKAKLLLIRGTMRNSKTDLTDAKALVDDVINNLPSNIKMEGDMSQTFIKAWDSQENIFVRYLEDISGRTGNAGSWSNYGLAYEAATKFLNSSGMEVAQSDAECGVKYGLDWMRSDPRWYIATGKARSPEDWDDTYTWTWTKIYRKGRYEGQISNPLDEKYACYHMRLPELYIMQAELIARTGGSISNALAPINLMRSKRSNPVLPQIMAPATLDELMEIIFKEYVNELILENGAEYYASLRFNHEGKTYMEVIKGGSFVLDKNKLQWPIPNEEIQSNPLIEQNPGQK